MSDFGREFLFALRRLRRSKAFSITSLAILGIGLGATTTMFSIVNAVLLRPLPFPNSTQLVDVSHTAAISGIQQLSQSDASFLLYQRHNTVFENIGVSRAADLSIAPLDAASGDAERTLGAGVTASWLSTLQVAPARGRGFTPDDDRLTAPRVVILSDALWRRKFGADPSLVGKNVVVNGSPRQVVGIMPASFRYPSASTQVWYPLQIDPARADPGSFNFNAIARLKPGVTREAATADLARSLPRLFDEFPTNIPRAMFEKIHLTPVVTPLHDVIVGDVSRLLWILLAAVGLVLAIACANVANLFLVRAEGRSRELAVRTALGAGGVSVVVQHLSEAIVLGIGGGAIGIGLAALGIRLLSSLPAGISVPRLAEVDLDPIVIAFTLTLTLVGALAVCIVPLLRSRHLAIASVLKESGRAATAGASKQRTRSMLVVAQVALALLLVASSGLLARSFARLRDVKPGFDATNVTTARVTLPRTKYATAAATLNFYDELTRQARALPGVRDVAYSSWLPLTNDQDLSAVTVEDYAISPDVVPPVHAVNNISSNWFSTIRIPMLAGRTLGEQTSLRPLLEAVVSKSFAARYWKGTSPLGRRVHQGIDGPWFTIVGVVDDVHLAGLDRPVEEAVYFPIVEPDGDSLLTYSRIGLAVATNQPAPNISADIRRIVHDLDAGLPTYDQQSMERIVRDASAKARFLVLMLGAASLVALVLGAVGIYGVMAYGVSLRQREIGVRMALGARPGDVSRMVSRQGVALAGVGILIGLAGAIATTRMLRGLLYDVSPTDPLTLGATCGVLLATALVSTWLPARRAANVDPASVLRSD